MLGGEESKQCIGFVPDTSVELETTRAVLLEDFAQRTREGEIQDVWPLHLGLSDLNFGERPC